MNFSAEFVRDRIISIVADLTMQDPEDLSAESLLNEIGLDSLSLIELVFAIEEAFEIQFPFDANNPDDSDLDITSIGSIMNAVEALLSEGQGAA